MAYEILGAEDKGEGRFIKPFLENLFKDTPPEKYRALAIVGLNPFKANNRELDLILMVSWNSASDNCVRLRKGQAIPKYCYDLKETILLQKEETIYLNSFIATVEIKSHDASGVKVNGADIYFRYGKSWHCATSKLIEQGKTASDFIRDQFRLRERVTHFIYTPNISNDQITVSENLKNVLLCRNVSIRDLLDKIFLQTGISGNSKANNGKQIYHRIGTKERSLFYDNGIHYERVKAYFTQLKPSSIEQEKMEIIAKRYIDDKKEWCKAIGEKLIAFTGRAGTGKTLKLLRTAKDLADDYMDNVLLLTFNKALARDLQRLMQLQKVSSGTAITVLTLDQFLFRVAFRVGILRKEEIEEFLNLSENSEQKKDVFLAVRELLQEAVQDLEKVEKIRHYYRDYTMVAIDEAQDWFQEERDVILQIFEPNKILIAAGTDQCLRAPTMANWKGDVQKKGFEIKPVHSNIALRQTSNLAHFCNNLSQKIGLDWSIDQNEAILGGEIYLYNQFDKNVLNILLKEINESDIKYFPIDYLILLSNQKGQSAKIKSIYKTLSENAINIWDAVTPADRNELPEMEKVRCVSLESCRGLEGWATLLFDLDLWVAFALEKESKRNENLDFRSLSSLPTWFLIPFTRAKKRMLIEIPKNNNELKEVLLRMQKENSDHIQIIN